MTKRSKKKSTVVFVCLWIIMLCMIIAHRDEISIDKIVNFSPDKPLLAALIILALFAAKGSSGLINADILYTSCGVMFSLPLALLVGMLGSFLMCTMPYYPSYKGGAELMDKLLKNNKKLEKVYSFPNENQFLFAFLLRLFGIIPFEIVSMYLGSCRLSYFNYIGGSLLGLFPSVLGFTVIGEYLSSPTSAQFIGATILKLSLPLLALLGSALWKKAANKKMPCDRKTQ